MVRQNLDRHVAPKPRITRDRLRPIHPHPTARRLHRARVLFPPPSSFLQRRLPVLIRSKPPFEPIWKGQRGSGLNFQIVARKPTRSANTCPSGSQAMEWWSLKLSDGIRVKCPFAVSTMTG